MHQNDGNKMIESNTILETMERQLEDCIRQMHGIYWKGEEHFYGRIIVTFIRSPNFK